MHRGSIAHAHTVAGRLYRLLGRRGYWHSAAALAALRHLIPFAYRPLTPDARAWLERVMREGGER